MTDPLHRHDAQQAAQDATEHVAQSIQDAAEVQALFTKAHVAYTSITPVTDGVVRVETADHFKEGALERIYKAMGLKDTYNGGAFTVSWQMDGRGGSAWVLVRRK